MDIFEGSAQVVHEELVHVAPLEYHITHFYKLGGYPPAAIL